MIEITTFVFVIHGIIYVYKIHQIPCDTLDIRNKKNLLILSKSPFIYLGSNSRNSNAFLYLNIYLVYLAYTLFLMQTFLYYNIWWRSKLTFTTNCQQQTSKVMRDQRSQKSREKKNFTFWVFDTSPFTTTDETCLTFDGSWY